MKKSLFLFLTISMLLLLFSCICFAGEASDASYDRDYPELGLRVHSWITGFGSETIAHTQTTDIKTGKLLKQSDTPCSYEDAPGILEASPES